MKRTMYAMLLLLGAVFVASGCTPGAISYLAYHLNDRKLPAACKLAEEGKEVTVAIVCRFAESPSSPELWTTDMEIADLLLAHLVKGCQDNGEKVKFVSNARVKTYLTRPISGVSSLQELGRQVKADKVIDLEIGSLSLLMPNSPGLLQARASVDVSLVIVDPAPGKEAVPFTKTYSLTFPKDRPDMDGDPRTFRNKVSTRIARDIHRYFTAWEPIRHEMD
jgi:phosphoribosyl-ATP pyrophosphohydrolase